MGIQKTLHHYSFRGIQNAVSHLSVVSVHCREDNNKLVVNIKHLEENQQILSNTISPPLESKDYLNENCQKGVVRNYISYAAGYLFRQTFIEHKCNDHSIFTNDNLYFDHSAFLFFKAYENESRLFGGLVAPSRLID